MYLIYNTSTGEPRMEVSSPVLAAANLEDGEAYITLDGDAPLGDFLVVDGRIVATEQSAFDPVSCARHARSGTLADTDWTQVGDSSLSDSTRLLWADYRQALRDFPANIAAVAADQDRAAQVSSIELVEDLLPTPPGG